MVQKSQNALAIEQDQSSSQQAQLQTQTQSSTLTNRLEDVQARDTQVSHIAQSITDLATLFEQLSSLVIEQGALVDRIDWNVETSAEHVQLAQRDLAAAQGHQRRSGKVQCIILLVLCIMLVGTIIVVKPFVRWWPSSATNPRDPKDLPPPPPPTPNL